MSNTLIIKHFCGDLEVSERENFLKLYGAKKVWFIKSSGHTAFASFETKEDAENALFKLHQLEIAGKRLSVEYANEKIAPQINIKDNVNKEISNLKTFIDKLHGRNNYIDFTQPVPPNISYKYPLANSHILFNIMYSLAKNMSFYTQTIHLMNKMNLDPPFDNISDSVKTYILTCLEEIGLYNINNVHKDNHAVSSEESEISHEEDVPISNDLPSVKPFKRKCSLKKISKRIKLQNIVPYQNKEKEKKIVPVEIFEEVPIHKSNKIEININQTLQNSNTSNDEVVGTITKMNITVQPEEISKNEENDDEVKYVISEEELFSNKISATDMKSLSVYKNYNPGIPSMRLYIKNLAKSVTSRDIKSIYLRYISSEEQEPFDVRVMQEGRMKGQAFVTLPSVEISKKALSDTNGFKLQNKPMVVQFARSANK